MHALALFLLLADYDGYGATLKKVRFVDEEHRCMACDVQARCASERCRLTHSSHAPCISPPSGCRCWVCPLSCLKRTGQWTTMQVSWRQHVFGAVDSQVLPSAAAGSMCGCRPPLHGSLLSSARNFVFSASHRVPPSACTSDTAAPFVHSNCRPQAD